MEVVSKKLTKPLVVPTAFPLTIAQKNLERQSSSFQGCPLSSRLLSAWGVTPSSAEAIR